MGRLRLLMGTSVEGIIVLQSTQHAFGIAAVTAINLVPIAALTLFADGISKDPVGVSSCKLPCSVALLAAALSSALAYKYGRGKSDCFDVYVLFGSAALFVMVVMYCAVSFSWFNISDPPSI